MTSEHAPRFSVVVPVYGNAETLVALVDRVSRVAESLPADLEIVFVVDGSPDRSMELLLDHAPRSSVSIQVVEHARNFGAFAAIRSGLQHARGEFIGVMAADLQEPPELMSAFFDALVSGEADVALGRRDKRHDPGLSSVLSRAYWALYRRWVLPEIPAGGVDVFAVTRPVAQILGAMTEQNTSLVGQLFWVGFRRTEVPYTRLQRDHGRSAWTFAKRWRYMLDSVYSFTDLPMRWLASLGFSGAVLTLVAAILVVVLRLNGQIEVAGYTPLMLAMLFCTFLLIFGLGVVGSYVWRAFENTKGRPHAVVRSAVTFTPADRHGGPASSKPQSGSEPLPGDR